MSFGATEIILIVAVIILFFGAKKIPELARGIGQGITEFKKVSNKDVESNEEQDTDEAPPK